MGPVQEIGLSVPNERHWENEQYWGLQKITRTLYVPPVYSDDFGLDKGYACSCSCGRTLENPKSQILRRGRVPS